MQQHGRELWTSHGSCRCGSHPAAQGTREVTVVQVGNEYEYLCVICGAQTEL